MKWTNNLADAIASYYWAKKFSPSEATHFLRSPKTSDFELRLKFLDYSSALLGFYLFFFHSGENYGMGRSITKKNRRRN